MKATGNVVGHWTEYEEQPLNHAKGYFWLRDDGLRVGLRLAGSYNRRGVKREHIPPPRTAHEIGIGHWGQADHDRAYALPFSNGTEELPTHMRIMRGEDEIELIATIGGVSIQKLMDEGPEGEDRIWAFIDEKWPRQDPKRTFSSY